MTQEHLIRPPHELVQQWVSLAGELEGFDPWQDLATQAARWGADQELEACCEWIHQNCGRWDLLAELRAARRPKPPSLKEQALQALEEVDDTFDINDIHHEAIRRAIESLPD